jgi:hypothetical protein
MLPLNIEQANIQRLKYERYNNPCPIIQKRCWSLYLKSTSKLTNGSICAYVEIHPDTLTDLLSCTTKKDSKEFLN